MITLTHQEYIQSDIQDNHILIISIPSCWICAQHVKNPYFRKSGIQTYLIETTVDDLNSLGITQAPVTRVMINKEIKFEIGGLLFPTQLRMIDKVLKGEE